MRIPRRTFIRISLLALVAAPSAKFAGTLLKAGTRYVTYAVKPSAYPGRLRPLDIAAMRAPGRWNG